MSRLAILTPDRSAVLAMDPSNQGATAPWTASGLPGAPAARNANPVLHGFASDTRHPLPASGVGHARMSRTTSCPSTPVRRMSSP
jgi:hypothetical protein